MRILHAIYDDINNPWVGGGGAIRTMEIYRRIRAQGHEVRVVCGNYPSAPRRHTRHGVIYRHVGIDRPHILSRLSYMLGAARLIRQGDFDIVVEDVSPYSPVAVPRWTRLPAVASVQNLSGQHATGKYGVFGWGPRLVEKPLLSGFHHFIAVSPGIATKLRRLLGSDIDVTVIANSAGDLAAPAQRLGLKLSEPYILSLGRIDIYQKGLDTLVEAFDLLAPQIPNIRLLIAGGGPDAQVSKLRKLVAQTERARRIEVLEQVERGEASRLLAGALMLAMPSRYEAWPLTAIEAGAVGVPVVGFNVVGVRDAAPPYPRGHGWLTTPGDIDAFVAAMREIATNRELAEALGSQGRKWAARFTWDELAMAQLSLYERILAGAAAEA